MMDHTATLYAILTPRNGFDRYRYCTILIILHAALRNSGLTIIVPEILQNSLTHTCIYMHTHTHTNTHTHTHTHTHKHMHTHTCTHTHSTAAGCAVVVVGALDNPSQGLLCVCVCIFANKTLKPSHTQTSIHTIHTQTPVHVTVSPKSS